MFVLAKELVGVPGLMAIHLQPRILMKQPVITMKFSQRETKTAMSQPVCTATAH